jgi:parallel beta-helix repeat protein
VSDARFGPPRRPVPGWARRPVVWALAAAAVAAAAPAVPFEAAAAPRDRAKLNPDALAILRSPSKLATSQRRHVIVRPDRVELWQGATSLESIPFNGRAATLPGVAAAVAASSHPSWLEETQPGVFLLRVALVQAPGSRLDVAVPAVRQVRLQSDPEVYISAMGAVGRYTGVQVTSWDPRRGRPQANPRAPRPFVRYGPGSTLEIVRSRFGYLGTDRSSGAYGVTWEGATGKAVSSVFHHNFFGVYTFAARDIQFVGNVFRDNALYGLDPHDYTTGLRVLGNRTFRNGTHGIVFSVGVTDAVIRDNHSFANGANGIVMDERSDRNVIVDNVVEDNNGDGIVLLGSSRILVRGNQVRSNRVGIRVNLRSAANRIEANKLDGNQRGIELYGGARDIQLVGNEVANSVGMGITLEAPGSTSQGDKVLDGHVEDDTRGRVGVEVRSLAHLVDTSVTGMEQGIVVTERAIATIERAQVRAGRSGVRVQRGGVVRVDRSRLVASSPFSGAAPKANTGNTLVSAEAAPPRLALAGAAFLVLAVVLQVVHRSRNRPSGLAKEDPGGRPGRGQDRPAQARRDLLDRRRLAARVRLGVALVAVVGGMVALPRATTPPIVVAVGSPKGVERIELGAGHADLGRLADTLADQGHRDLLVRSGRGWLLARTLVVRPGAQLDVEGELRLLSEPHAVVGLEARGGQINVSHAVVTSWNRRSGAPDADVRDGRAWVLARGGASMEVLDSRMQQLGYDRAERYGVAWRTRGTGGEVRGSTFTGNFYGLYTYDVEPMRIRDSVIERSHLYGLDPHTGSRGFVIENNQFRDNGKHGMILADDCSGAVVRNNRVYRNRAHGLVVFQDSDDVVVEHNEVHDNGLAGIDVDDAAGTRVLGNVVYANRTGVSMHDQATGVIVEGNRLSANRVDGIRVATGASVAAIRGNLADYNYRAGAYLAGGQASLGPGNRLLDNEAGVWISGRMGSVTVAGNTIGDNVLDGVHLGRETATLVIEGNTILTNGKAAFSVEVTGAARQFAPHNTVAGNEDGLERLRGLE